MAVLSHGIVSELRKHGQIGAFELENLTVNLPWRRVAFDELHYLLEQGRNISSASPSSSFYHRCLYLYGYKRTFPVLSRHPNVTLYQNTYPLLVEYELSKVDFYRDNNHYDKLPRNL